MLLRNPPSGLGAKPALYGEMCTHDKHRHRGGDFCCVKKRKVHMDILLVGPTFSPIEVRDQVFHATAARAYTDLFLAEKGDDVYGLHAGMSLHHAVTGRVEEQLSDVLGVRDWEVLRVSLLLSDADTRRSTLQIASWHLTIVRGRAKGASMTVFDRVLTERKTWLCPPGQSLETWLSTYAKEEDEARRSLVKRCRPAPQDRRERRFRLPEPHAFGLLPDLFFQLFLNTHPELDALPPPLLRLPRAKR